MSKCQTKSKSFIGCRFIDAYDTDKVKMYDVTLQLLYHLHECRSVLQFGVIHIKQS